MNNNKLEILYKIGVVTFPLLKLGFERFWCTKKDVIDYAVFYMAKKEYANNDLIALLAGADYEEENIVQEYAAKFIKDENIIDNYTIEKWKVAFLIEVKEMSCSERERIDLLQLVYSTFDYSQDLAELSIYNADGICPIKAMNELIERKLKILNVAP